VLRGSEQPRDECATADTEHSADRHDETEQGSAKRDGRQKGGVVQRADETRIDDVVDSADDHRRGHRHAQVHERADDRSSGEIPAVGADGVGWCGEFEVRGAHDCSFPGRLERAPTSAGTARVGMRGAPG
jgi:hypothetical protein